MAVAAVAAASRWNYLGNLLHFQCEPGLGASVMYNLLYFPPYKLMLLAGCSTVCTTVAEAAKMWNLVVVSAHPYPFLPPPDRVYANLTFFFRGYTLRSRNMKTSAIFILSSATVHRRRRCLTEIDSRPCSGRILPPPCTIPRESNCWRSLAGPA